MTANGADVDDAWAEECALRAAWKRAGSPLHGNDYEILARACARTRSLVVAVGTQDQRASRAVIVDAARSKISEIVVAGRRIERNRRLGEIRAEMVKAQACGDRAKLDAIMREVAQFKAEGEDQ